MVVHHAVVSTPNSETALQLAKEAMGAGEPFGLLVTDFGIEGRMNGLMLAQEIRRMDPSIKVIKMSSDDTTPPNEYFDRCFEKPLSFPSFLSAISELLEEKELAGKQMPKVARKRQIPAGADQAKKQPLPTQF